MIKSIRIKNWRSHEDTTLEFDKGTNVVIGVMGAGKTTVMDAICFALFGTFPTLNAKKLKLDDCIMNKPEQKQVASIEITFVLGEKEYSVKREVILGKGTKKAELRENGRLLEATNSTLVSEAVRKILKMDYELFSRAVYSEQNGIDYFLQIPGGQRKKKIDELLRIDRFEKARKNNNTLVNRIKDHVKDKKSFVESYEGDQELEKQEKELGKILEENNTKEKLYENKSKELQEQKKVLEELIKKQKQAKEAKEELIKLNTEKENLEKTIQEIKEKLGKFVDADLKTKKKEIEEKISKINISEKEKTVQELRTKKSLAEKELEEEKEKQKKKQELEKKLSKLKENYDLLLTKEKETQKQLQEKEASLKAIIEQEKKRIEGLEGVDGKCPICDSELGEHKKEELEKHSKKILEEKQRELKEINSKKSSKLIEELENKIKEKKLLEEKFNEIKESKVNEKQLLELNKELEEKQLEIEKNKKEIDELKEKSSKIDRITDKQEEYFNGKRRLEEIKKRLLEQNKIEFVEDELIEKTRSKHEKIMIEVNELKTTLEMNKKIVGEKELLVKELKKKKEFVEQNKKEVEALERTVGSLKTFSLALDSTQTQLREEFTQAINAGLEDIWPKVYPYGDYVNLRLAVVNGDYTLELMTRNEQWVPVEGVASGGERSTAALTLRIAFALVLTQNLSWLVLDEPTHNLDSQGVALLSEMMKNHLPDLVEQIFVITHDEEMEGAVSGTLYRLERDKSENEPTKAVLVSSGKE